MSSIMYTTYCHYMIEGIRGILMVYEYAEIVMTIAWTLLDSGDSIYYCDVMYKGGAKITEGTWIYEIFTRNLLAVYIAQERMIEEADERQRYYGLMQ